MTAKSHRMSRDRLNGGSSVRFIDKDDAGSCCRSEQLCAMLIEIADRIQTRRGFPYESLGVDSSASRQKAGDLRNAIVEQQNGPSLIATSRVIETNPDLQDALIELPDLASLSMPFMLDLFVTGVEFAGIEEFDTGDDSWWQSSIA